VAGAGQGGIIFCDQPSVITLDSGHGGLDISNNFHQ
jgi:hypothetical protein